MSTNIVSVITAKRAAKELKKHCTHLQLSSCQRHIAQSLGFRDWHHLNQECGTGIVQTPKGNLARLTIGLAKNTNIQSHDALHILITARFFGTNFKLDDALAVRAEIFALEDFANASKNTTGAVCRVKTSNLPVSPALLVSRDGTCKAMTDHSTITTTDSELPFHPEDNFFIPMRFWMPYGVWTESDNTKVIFSREYCPLWRIVNGRIAERDDPKRRVTYSKQKYFFNESTFCDNDAAQKGLDILKEHRVISVPNLVEWLPECLKTGGKISAVKYRH